MSTAVPIIRAAGEGEYLLFSGGGLMTIKATSAETGGAFLLFEDRVVRGKTTPLHIYQNEDETFYVLDGEILIFIEGVEHRVGPRGMAVAPRGIPHAFMVVSETARLLTLLAPGSAESFYRAASDPATADTDPSGPVDFERVRRAAERSGGMKIVGPPPFKAS
jgi:quercetin dioxygenase-like cupin family protein